MLEHAIAPAKFHRSLDVYTFAYQWWLICAISLLIFRFVAAK